ncbi:inorganic diphosphatase [Candidatus Woesebacteria bacterium]|nr:inorganic diphosphatase [Candidatus Woesebacteria bacterium]
MTDTVKVLIEIPAGSNVKYELDEETGEMVVDRLMPTAMRYPVNYGLIDETSGEDGDALDALVFISADVVPGVVIKCKVLGVLEMEDEEGVDHKIVCVPAKTKIDPICGAWESLSDIPAAKMKEIKHFFEHYKDLEEGKWVKLKDWKDASVAQTIIEAGYKRYEAQEESCCADGCDCKECESGCDCDGKECNCECSSEK